MPNGISPFNKRPVTPEKEQRAMMVMYSFFLGFGLVGAITYPIWSHVQHTPMTADGWFIVAVLTAMAGLGLHELINTARKVVPAVSLTQGGTASLTLQAPTRIGNVIEVEIETADGSEPNVLFVTDNVGNTYTQVRPGLFRAVNFVFKQITVSISFNPGVNLEFRVKEWGEES